MLDREAIRLKLMELVETETDRKPESVADSVRLRDQLGLDSLDLVGVIMRIEDCFHIRLTHQDLEALTTVGELIDSIREKSNASSSAVAA
jgi:acyl carrier protein